MSAQQIAAARHRRRAVSVVALLLVALAVGSVTAVNLFPARASQRPLAGAVGTTALAQAADESTRMNEFRAGERASLAQAADESTRMNEFRAGERASLAQAAGETKYGPPGR